MTDAPSPPKDDGAVTQDIREKVGILEGFDAVMTGLPVKWRSVLGLVAIGSILFLLGYSAGKAELNERVTHIETSIERIDRNDQRMTLIESRMGVVEASVKELADVAERVRRIDREICQMQAQGTQALQQCASR